MPTNDRVHPPHTSLPKHIALVYQDGFAYVFQVQELSIRAKKRGRHVLLLKSSYVEAWRFAEGLVTAGWTADTFHCPERGNPIGMAWSRKLEQNNWHDFILGRVVRTVPS